MKEESHLFYSFCAHKNLRLIQSLTVVKDLYLLIETIVFYSSIVVFFLYCSTKSLDLSFSTTVLGYFLEVDGVYSLFVYTFRERRRVTKFRGSYVMECTLIPKTYVKTSFINISVSETCFSKRWVLTYMGSPPGPDLSV